MRDEQVLHWIRLAIAWPSDAAFHATAVIALAIGLGHKHRNVAFFNHIGAFGKGVLHVDGNGDRADFRARHASCDMLRTVIQLHAHVVVRAHALGQKKVRNPIDICIELGIREIAPGVVLTVELKKHVISTLFRKPIP